MNINLGQVLALTKERIQELIRDLEQAFEEIPENVRRTYDATLNFAAPAAVPGITSQNVTIAEAEIGDTVIVGAPVAVPAGFLPPMAAVTAANTVTVYWFQLTGAAADPDGAGGIYKIDLYRH